MTGYSRTFTDLITARLDKLDDVEGEACGTRGFDNVAHEVLSTPSSFRTEGDHNLGFSKLLCLFFWQDNDISEDKLF